MYIFIFLLALLVTAWIIWRILSKKTLLPCPSKLSWLVELENPIARATRSEHVVRLLALAEGSRVMDVGCGPGRVTIPLAKAIGPTGEVIALDVQPKMLDRLTEKIDNEKLTNIRLIQSDIRDLSVSSYQLDAIVIVMALGEIPDPSNALSNLTPLLKMGGHLLVSESLFDPHYVRRSKLASITESNGLELVILDGNSFGYSAKYRRVK